MRQVCYVRRLAYVWNSLRTLHLGIGLLTSCLLDSCLPASRLSDSPPPSGRGSSGRGSLGRGSLGRRSSVVVVGARISDMCGLRCAPYTSASASELLPPGLLPLGLPPLGLSASFGSRVFGSWVVGSRVFGSWVFSRRCWGKVCVAHAPPYLAQAREGGERLERLGSTKREEENLYCIKLTLDARGAHPLTRACSKYQGGLNT